MYLFIFHFGPKSKFIFFREITPWDWTEETDKVFREPIVVLAGNVKEVVGKLIFFLKNLFS